MTSKRTPRAGKVKRRNRKDASTKRLLVEVGKWVNANGGNAALTGPVQIQTWPGDPHYKFQIVVGVLGRKPEPISK